MRRFVYTIIVMSMLITSINCTDSEEGQHSSDIFNKDIIIDDSGFMDISNEDINMDTATIIDADVYIADDTGILTDTPNVTDTPIDITEDVQDTQIDIFTDTTSIDISEDIVQDITEEIIDISTDTTYDIIEDVGTEDTETVPDTSPNISPPTLVLLTASPSLETNIKIGGQSPDGTQILIFKNRDCSSKPIATLSKDYFNQNGYETEVSQGSTTYFSAYATDGSSQSICSNVLTYVHHNNQYWRITFFDDFKGIQPGDDPECYSMPPQCIGEYLSTLYECPQSETHKGLSALNKCTWTILRQPNWMAKEYGPSKNMTNGFSPLEVSVDPDTDNGILILSANAYRWDGTRLNPSTLTTQEKTCLQQTQSNWLLHENNSPDCRNTINYNCVWNSNTTNCPILSGAVYSKKFSIYKQGNNSIPKERGFIQNYGRWEVRAKLPYGMGSFPAHWLLPQSGSWPEAGEIDIMEADRYAKDSYQTYHTGYCEGTQEHYYINHQVCLDNGGQRYHLAKGGRLSYRNGSFSNDYHTFSVEWSPDRIDYYTDDILVNSIIKESLNYGVFTSFYRTTGQARAMNIPFLNFFIILNQTVHNDSYGDIDPLNFIPHLHIIDYVKVYNICSAPSDFCRDGYYYDGNDKLCHPNDKNGIVKPYISPCGLKEDIIPQPKPLNTQVFYPCTDPCPYGGWFDGSNCAIFNSPSNREVFFYPNMQGNMYYVTDGSPNGNCNDTVEQTTFPVGTYDGANCLLDKTLPELYGKYFVWGSPKPNGIYYQPFCKFQ